VRTPAPGSLVYKVTAGDVDSPTGEPFAITATRPLTPLVTPQPTVSLSVGAQGPVRAGQPVRVEATVANPSPDLTAENTQVTLSLPPGVQLTDGAPTRTLGTLTPKGADGDRAVVSWTVRGSADGLHHLTAIASATRYGSTFRSSTASSLNVDAQPPRVTIVAPAAATSDMSIPLTWSAVDDGAGVASFDVDVAIDGQAFVPWIPGTTETWATFPGTAGARYRFRVRARDAFGNVSDYVTTPELETTNTSGAGSDPGPADPPHRALLPPELRITSVRRTATRLVVRGTVAHGASGKVTASWTPRRKGRLVRASTYAHLQAYTLKLAIPRRQRPAKRGSLVVRYLGGADFADDVQRRVVAFR
jgi:hypothetical protein